MNAIIAGASGLVGRFLLNDLLSRDRYERVIALVRSDLGLSSPKLSTARVDFSALDSTAPGDGRIRVGVIAAPPSSSPRHTNSARCCRTARAP